MHRSGRVNPCRYLCSPFNDCQYSAVIAVEIKGETGMELVLLLFFLPLHKFKPMTSQCSISVPPKNIRKQMLSDVFRGYRNKTFV